MENKFRSLAKCSEKRQEKKLSRALYLKKRKIPPNLLLNSCTRSVMKAERYHGTNRK